MSTITEIQEAITRLAADEKTVLSARLQSQEEPVMSEAEEAALLASLDKAATELDAGKGVPIDRVLRTSADGLQSNFRSAGFPVA